MPKTLDVKLVLLGDGSVGKTSLVSYYLKKSIPSRYIPTIGSIILKKDYKLKGLQLRVNIWDIGGQRSFNPLNPSFYTNVDAAYLVFDLNKPKETLADIKNVYLENLEKYAKDCQTIVVGNKLDEVSIEKELKKIKQHFSEDIPILITSAKSGTNVIETFELLIYTFLINFETVEGNEDYIGTADKFLKSIGKKEDELYAILVNLRDTSSIKIKKPMEKKTTSSKVQEKEITNQVQVEEMEKQTEMDKYIPISEELVKLSTVKDEILANFDKNLSKIETLLLNLKKSPIDSLIESIDKTKIEIELIKEEFKLSLTSILNLNEK